MSDMKNSEPLNAREFSRVETHIPLEVRIVPQDERQYVRSRIEDELHGLALPQDIEDQLLSDWLKLLNKKIDILLGILLVKPESIDVPACIAENISGGGLSFFSKTEYPHNEILEIKIRFIPKLLKVLYVYGKVVQSVKRDEGFVTAIEFIILNDSIRDEIIKFVFEREREILRERRRT